MCLHESTSTNQPLAFMPLSEAATIPAIVNASGTVEQILVHLPKIRKLEQVAGNLREAGFTVVPYVSIAKVDCTATLHINLNEKKTYPDMIVWLAGRGDVHLTQSLSDARTDGYTEPGTFQVAGFWMDAAGEQFELRVWQTG